LHDQVPHFAFSERRGVERREPAPLEEEPAVIVAQRRGGILGGATPAGGQQEQTQAQ
jgi:hypothetical protein